MPKEDSGHEESFLQRVVRSVSPTLSFRSVTCSFKSAPFDGSREDDPQAVPLRKVWSSPLPSTTGPDTNPTNAASSSGKRGSVSFAPTTTTLAPQADGTIIEVKAALTIGTGASMKHKQEDQSPPTDTKGQEHQVDREDRKDSWDAAGLIIIHTSDSRAYREVNDQSMNIRWWKGSADSGKIYFEGNIGSFTLTKPKYPESYSNKVSGQDKALYERLSTELQSKLNDGNPKKPNCRGEIDQAEWIQFFKTAVNLVNSYQDMFEAERQKAAIKTP